MRTRLWTRPYFPVAVCLALLAQAGCGRAPRAEPSPPEAGSAAAAAHTVAFHVPQMSHRLKLL